MKRCLIITSILFGSFLIAAVAPAQVYIPIQPGTEFPTAALSFPLSATYTVEDVSTALQLYGVDGTDELPTSLQKPAKANETLTQRIRSITVTFENYNPAAWAELQDIRDEFGDLIPTEDPRGIEFDPYEDLLPLNTNALLSGVALYAESGDIPDVFNYKTGDPTSDIPIELRTVTEDTPLQWTQDPDNPLLWRVTLYPRDLNSLNSLRNGLGGLPNFHIVIRPTLQLHQEDQFRASIEPDDIVIEHRFRIKGALSSTVASINLPRYPVTFPSEAFVRKTAELDFFGNELPYNPYAILPDYADIDADRFDSIGYSGLYTVQPIFFGDIVRIVNLTTPESRVPAESDAVTVMALDLMGLPEEDYFISDAVIGFVGLDMQVLYQHLDEWLGLYGGLIVGTDFVSSGFIDGATLPVEPPSALTTPTGVEEVDSLINTAADLYSNAKSSYISLGGYGNQIAKYMQAPPLYADSPPLTSSGNPYDLFDPDTDDPLFTAARGSTKFRQFSADVLASFEADTAGGALIYADNKDDVNNTPSVYDRGVDSLVALNGSQIFIDNLDVPSMYADPDMKTALAFAINRVIPGTVSSVLSSNLFDYDEIYEGIVDINNPLTTMIDVQPVANLLPAGALREYFPYYYRLYYLNILDGAIAQALQSGVDIPEDVIEALKETRKVIIDQALAMPSDTEITPNYNEQYEYKRDQWFINKPILGFNQPDESSLQPVLRKGYDAVAIAVRNDWKAFVDDDPLDPSTYENNPTTTTAERFFGQQVVGGFQMVMPISNVNSTDILGVPGSDDADFDTEEPELFLAIKTSNRVRALDTFIPFVVPGSITVKNNLSKFNKNADDPDVQTFRSVASAGLGLRGSPVTYPVVVRPRPKFFFEDLTVPGDGETATGRSNILGDASKGSPPQAVIGINAFDFGANATLMSHDIYSDGYPAVEGFTSNVNATFFNESIVFDGLSVDIIPTDTEMNDERIQDKFSGLDIVNYVGQFMNIDDYLNRRMSAHNLTLYADDDTEAGDGVDNDGDGLTDEELRNWKDDDGDGLVDEDCGDGDGTLGRFGNGNFDEYDDYIPYAGTSLGVGQSLNAPMYITAPVLKTGLFEWRMEEGFEPEELEEDIPSSVLNAEDVNDLQVVLNLHPLKFQEYLHDFTAGDGSTASTPDFGDFEPWTARINLWPTIFNALLTALPVWETEVLFPDRVFIAPGFDEDTGLVLNPGGPLPGESGLDPRQQFYNMYVRNLPVLSQITVLSSPQTPTNEPAWSGPYPNPTINFQFNIENGYSYRGTEYIGLEQKITSLRPLVFGDLEDGSDIGTRLTVGIPPSNTSSQMAVNVDAYRVPAPGGLFRRVGINPLVVHNGPRDPESLSPYGADVSGTGMSNNAGGTTGMNQFGMYMSYGDVDVDEFVTTQVELYSTAIVTWIEQFFAAHGSYQDARDTAQEDYDTAKEEAANEEDGEPPELPDPIDFTVPEPAEIVPADPSIALGLDGYIEGDLDGGYDSSEVAYLLDVPDEDQGPMQGNDFFVVLRAAEAAEVGDKFIARIRQGEREAYVPDPADPVEGENVIQQARGLLYSTFLNIADIRNHEFEGESTASITTGEITVRSDNVPPTITITSPGVGENPSNEELEFVIAWEAFDPDNVAEVSLYVDTDNKNADGQLIATSLQEGEVSSLIISLPDDIDGFDPRKNYYVYAVITDNINEELLVYSDGSIRAYVAGEDGDEENPLTADVVDYYKLFSDGTIRKLGQGPTLESVSGLGDLEQTAVDMELTSNFSGALVVSSGGRLLVSQDIGSVLNEYVNANNELVLAGNPATDLVVDPDAPVIDEIVDVEADFISGAVYILDRDGEIIALGAGAHKEFQRKITGDDAGADLYRDMALTPNAEGLYLLRTNGAVEVVGNAEGVGGNGALFGDGVQAADMVLTRSGDTVSGLLITDEFGNIVSRSSNGPANKIGLPLETNSIRSIVQVPNQARDYLLMTGGGLIYPATTTTVALPTDSNVFGDEPGRADDKVVDIETVPFNLQRIPTLVGDVLSAFGNEDINTIMSLASANYLDQSGNDRDGLKQALTQFFNFFDMISFNTGDTISALPLEQSRDRVRVNVTVGYSMYTPRVDFFEPTATDQETLGFETFALPTDSTPLPFSQDIRIREVFDGRGWKAEVLLIRDGGNESFNNFDPTTVVEGETEAITAYNNLKALGRNQVLYSKTFRSERGAEGEKLVHVDVGSFRDFNVLLIAFQQLFIRSRLAPPTLEMGWYQGARIMKKFEAGGFNGSPNVSLTFQNNDGVFELVGFTWPMPLAFHSAPPIISEDGTGVTTLTDGVDDPHGFSFTDRGPVIAVLSKEADFVIEDGLIEVVTSGAGIVNLGANVDIYSISTEEILAGRTRSSFMDSTADLIDGNSYAVVTTDKKHFGLVTYMAGIYEATDGDEEGTLSGGEFIWRYDKDRFVFPSGY